MKQIILPLTAVPLFAWITGCNPVVEDNKTDLEGRWISNCYYDSADNNYDKFDFTYTGESVSVIATSYNTADCITPTITLKSSGTYILGDEITLESGDKVVAIDYKLTYQLIRGTILDIIKLEGNTYKHGKSPSPSVRPTELDPDVIFTKQ